MSIFRDKFGFPTDCTSDGGDSAMRAGVLGTFMDDPITPTGLYSIGWGTLVRHPKDVPWDNPKNFTRDQMMCLVSALKPQFVKAVFWSRVKAFCFAQNTERDYLGTTKYPWPHHYIDDRGVRQFTWFDFADPLFPHHMGHIARCTKSVWYLPAFWLGLPFLLAACYFNKGGEQNQLQCMVYRAGPWWVKFYKKHRPNWDWFTFRYWSDRSEVEYADAIVAAFKKEG